MAESIPAKLDLSLAALKDTDQERKKRLKYYGHIKYFNLIKIILGM